jgi:Rod binding domain-containing protein
MGTTALTGALAAQAQSGLMKSREDHMLQQLRFQQAGDSDAKIEKSSREFESMLLNTWLQQAEQSMATVPGAEDDEDAGNRDQMLSLGVQTLSTSLAASGGIGIAKMISKALHSAQDNVEAAAKAGSAGGAPQVGK